MHEKGWKYQLDKIKDIQVASKYMKMCSMPLVIRELQEIWLNIEAHVRTILKVQLGKHINKLQI
jgi:hypothetical protein